MYKIDNIKDWQQILIAQLGAIIMGFVAWAELYGHYTLRFRHVLLLGIPFILIKMYLAEK